MVCVFIIFIPFIALISKPDWYQSHLGSFLNAHSLVVFCGTVSALLHSIALNLQVHTDWLPASWICASWRLSFADISKQTWNTWELMPSLNPNHFPKQASSKDWWEIVYHTPASPPLGWVNTVVFFSHRLQEYLQQN